jgi:K+-sensing histidine kinase KdpD
MEMALGGLAPVLVAMALVGVRSEVNSSNLALVLMVVVVVAAAVGGRGAGIIAAISAAVSFDFFLTRPYLSLSIEKGDDVETAVLMLVAGAVVGYVAARGRHSRVLAAESRSEIGRIRRLADLTATGTDPADVIMAGQAELTELLKLQDCTFEAPPFDRSYLDIERTGVVATRDHVLGDGGFELPHDGAALPVLGRGQLLGRFVLEPTPGQGLSLERRVVAVALADQVGAALAASPADRRLQRNG